MDWQVFVFSGVTLICSGIFVNEFVYYHQTRFKRDSSLRGTFLNKTRHILRVLLRTS